MTEFERMEGENSFSKPHNELGTININEAFAFRFKSRLIINGGDMVIETPRAMPGRWYRFWYKALLGWQWEPIERP